MAEYIERETAYDTLTEYYHHSTDTQHGALREALSRVPIADVETVERSRWVKASGSWFTPGGDPVWECFKCGKGKHVYGIEHGTYGSDVSDGQWVSCPNCGAKMDGEEINRAPTIIEAEGKDDV